MDANSKRNRQEDNRKQQTLTVLLPFIPLVNQIRHNYKVHHQIGLLVVMRL